MTNRICFPDTTVVLLAGGFGTRVAHLLPNIPKPMAEVAGRPFIEWVIRYFGICGFNRFIVSTGHLSEAMENHFALHPLSEATVICRKETSPLGTGGGFLNAIKTLPEPANGWLVANGDSLVVTNPGILIQLAQKNGWTAAVLGLEVYDASRFGSLQIETDGTLRSFAEKRPGSGLVNAGVYWFACGQRDRMSTKRPLSFELDVFPRLLTSGERVGVVSLSAPFIDIGTPESLVAADDFVRRNLKTTD
jgi:D-glycero-alpha-D-manno-heptose 1-phosphate guanylyltransferase